MTESDLDVLCGFLIKVPLEELYCLDEATMLWLPPLKGMASRTIVNTIRRSLELVKSLDDRLEIVAWLYCWMMPRNILRQWMLYKLSESLCSADFTLHKRLSSAMALPGCDNVFTPASSRSALYACIMTNEPFSGALDHQVVGLYVWRGLPYLAVYVSGERILRQFKAAFGTLMLTDSEALLDGYHFDLESTFAAICPNIGGSSWLGTGETEGANGFALMASQENGQPTSKYQLAANEDARHYAEEPIMDDRAIVSLLTPPSSDNSATDNDNPHFINGNNVGAGPASPREAAVAGEVSAEIKGIFMCQDCNKVFDESSIRANFLACPSCGCERCRELV